MKYNFKHLFVSIMFCLIIILSLNINVYGIDGYVKGDGESIANKSGNSLTTITAKTDDIASGVRNMHAKNFQEMAKDSFIQTNIIESFTLKEGGSTSTYPMVLSDDAISDLIDKVGNTEITMTFVLQNHTYNIKSYNSMWTYEDENGEIREAFKNNSKVLEGLSDSEKEKMMFQWYVSQGTIKFLQKISTATKLGLIGGSVGSGYNVGVVYSDNQVSLEDAMERQSNGFYDFKNANAMSATFSYYMSPILGKVNFPEGINPPKTLDEWNNFIANKTFTDGNKVLLDSAFVAFESGLSENEINDKGLKKTTNITFSNGIKRVTDVAYSQDPKSVISYNMPIAVPYIFKLVGNSYQLDIENLRVLDGIQYCLVNDKIYNNQFVEITNRAKLLLTKNQIFLFHQTVNNEKKGIVLIGQFDECVVDTTQGITNGRFYDTGRRIGFNNGYSELLVLDKSNVHLMFKTGDAGITGYIPLNVAFPVTSEEFEILEKQHSLTLAERLSNPDLYEYLEKPNKEIIYSDIKDIDNHIDVGNKPRFFKLYIDMFKSSNITSERQDSTNTNGADNTAITTDGQGNLIKASYEHYAFMMIRNNRFVNDADLISWLKTDRARSITYVDADTLLTRITGDFSNSLDPLTYENWSKMQEIKKELQSENSTWLIRVINVVSIIFGVVLIVFSILLCLAYWIDIFNTLSDFSILQFISFGNLYPVATKETIPYLVENKGQMKYVNFFQLLGIAGICCGLGVLFLNVTVIIDIIVRLYTYFLNVLGGV